MCRIDLINVVRIYARRLVLRVEFCSTIIQCNNTRSPHTILKFLPFFCSVHIHYSAFWASTVPSITRYTVHCVVVSLIFWRQWRHSVYCDRQFLIQSLICYTFCIKRVLFVINNVMALYCSFFVEISSSVCTRMHVYSVQWIRVVESAMSSSGNRGRVCERNTTYCNALTVFRLGHCNWLVFYLANVRLNNFEPVQFNG